MSKSVFKLIKFVLASAVLMFTSCEIGLGSAVDTEPPSIRLLQPEADSIVRDKIIISGNWSDDLKLRNIKLQLKDVNEVNTIIAVPEDAIIAGNETGGTWNCEVDTKGLNIPDGTYVVTATAYDDADHSSISSTTISIDNTPPLIVLENPTTTDINKPNEYGQSFTITGKAADDSDVDSIDFIFYDENGNELHRKNIAGVGTQLEVTVAKWGDEVYNKIYGEDRLAGDKKYYVGLIAYDGARKVPAEEGDKGNAATTFYLWDELEEQIGVIKTSVGYKIMNGRSAASADDKTKWKDALENLKKDRATFSLNPVNNPYFEVSRFEGFTEGAGNLDNNEFTNKNTLALNIYRGRDKKAIRIETIGVYLRECNKQGVKIEGVDPVVLLQPYADKNGNVYKDAAGNELISKAAHNDSIKSLDSSYTTTFSVNNEVYTGLAFNKYYVLDVVGYDINGVPVENSLSYGFKMVTTATPPTITIESPANGGNIPKSTVYEVKGLAKTQEDGITVAIYKGAAEGTPFATSAAGTVKIGAYDKDNASFPFSFKIDTSAETVTEDGTLPKIVIETTSSSGLVTTQAVKIDPVLPEIGDYSVTPTVEEGEGDNIVSYVNGTVLVKQQVSDNQMIKLSEYSLDDGATWTAQGATNMLAFNLDTTQYPDNSEKTIKIRVTDTAGNVSTGNIKLNIKQSTDAPEVKLSNIDIGQTTIDLLIAADAASKNIFNSMNNKLLGTITDDDGISKIEILYKEVETTDWKTIELNGNGRTSYNLIHELKDKDGKRLPQGEYSFKFIVTDNKNDQTGYSVKESSEFVVVMDEGAPNFVVSTSSGSLQAPNTDLPVAGLWEDGTDIVITRCKLIDGEYETESSSSDVASKLKVIKETQPDGTVNKKWEDKIPASIVGENGGTRYYIATDKYGQQTVQMFVFKVDSLPPTFTITHVNGTPITLDKDSGDYSAFAKASGIFTVKGKLAEPDPDKEENQNEGSGLDDFIYYYITANSSDVSEENGAYVIDGNSKTWGKTGITKTPRTVENSETAEWAANIDISSGYEEGTRYTLYIAAKDKARNISKIADNPSAKIILTPDENGPAFNDADDVTSGVQELYVSNTNVISTTTENITFKVNVTDATSGVDTVYLYRNDAMVKIGEEGNKQPLLPIHTDGTSVYNFIIPSTVEGTDSVLQTGANQFTVRATDKVGNSKDSVAVTVNVDKEPPIISINGVSPRYTQSDISNVTTYVVAGNIKVSGIATDETKLKEIRWFFGDVPADKSAVTGQSQTIDGSYKAFEIPVDANSLSYTNNKVTMTIVAVDQADNISQVATCILGKDTDAPVVEGVKVKGTDLDATTEYFYSKDNSITITGTAAEVGTDTSLQSGLSKVEFGVAKGHVTSWPTETTNIQSVWQLTSGSSSSWTAKIDSDSIATEGEYTVFIKATDVAGNEKIYDTPIKIVADAAKPVIEVTSTVKDYYTGAAVIEGTVTETYLRGFTVAVSKDGGDATNLTPDTMPIITGKQASAQNWKITIAAADGEYVVKISAKDELSTTNYPNITFAIDTTAPTFTITKVKGEDIPLDASSTAITRYGNKTDYFTIKGTVNDPKATGAAYASGVATSINYIVKETTSPLSSVTSYTIDSTWSSVPLKSDGTWEAPVSFASFDEGKECYVYFALQDKAGNTSVVANNPSNKITVKLDQTEPVINETVILVPGNTETTITVKATDGETGSGIGATSAVLKLDGVEYKNTDGSKAAMTYTAGTTAADESTYVFTIPNNKAKLNVGTNTFTVTVTDDARNSSTSSAVTIDYKAAELSASVPSTLFTGSDGYNYSGADFNISGNVSAPDGNTIKKLEWAEGVINASTVWNDITSTINSGNFVKAITSNANVSISATMITFRATTSFGKESTAVIKYGLDKTAPLVDDSNTKVGETLVSSIASSWFNSTTLVLDGQYTESGSGIKELKYYLKKDGDSDYPVNPTGTITPIDKGSIETFNKTISGFVDGTNNSIKLTATDNVGNSATKEISAIHVDTKSPEIKVYDASTDLEIADSTTVIRVAAKDSGCGIDESKIVIKLGDDVYTKAGTPVSSAGTGIYAGYTLYTYTIQNNDSGLEEGSNKMSVSFTDKVGNSSTSKAITINNDAPIFSNVAIKDADSKNKKGEFVYENALFEIEGNVSVGSFNKLKSVTWKDSYGATPTVLKTGESSATMSDTINPLDETGTPSYKSYENNLVTRTYTAENVYGKTSTAVVKFITDITKPVVQPITVGGKSEADLGTDWLNVSALKVVGSYLENGSGLSSVKIKLNDVENEAAVSSNVDSGNTYYAFDSTISGFVEGDTNTLVFNTTDKATNSAIAKTLSTIKIDTTAPQLAQTYKPGKNTGNQNNLWYRKAGETEWNEFTTSILTNRSKNIELRGAFSDANGEIAVSGVKSIKIKIGTYNIDALTVPAAGSSSADFAGAKNGNWQATVDFSTVNLETGSHTMSFELVDCAGNTTKTNNGTILVDASKPEVKINPITDSDTDNAGTQVNKAITLVGTASDNNTLKEVAAIEISSDYNAAAPASATWTALSTSNAGTNYALSGTTNWTAANFDTTKFTDGTYFIRAKAIDEAGNEGYSTPVEIKIDQNSDRPVIKIPSLASVSAFVQDKTLMGTISDDDGIRKLYISSVADTFADADEVTVTSGSWKKDFEAGIHTIYFKVVDTAGEEFITSTTAGDSAALTRPYVAFGTSSKGDNNSAITLSVDLKAPEFSAIKFNISGTTPAAGSSLPAFPEDPATDSTWETVSGRITYSPSKPYMYVKLVVAEDVSMHEEASDLPADDVTVNLGGNLSVVTDGTFSRTKDTTKTPNEYTYLIGPIDLTEKFAAGDGTKTITITAKDKSGRATSSTFNISTDTTAPTVTVNYPGTGDVIDGKVTLLGSLSDTTGISLTEGDIQYMIPTIAQQAKTETALLSETGWKNLTVTGNLFAALKLEFDSSAYSKPVTGESLIYYATKKTGDDYDYATALTGDDAGKLTVPVYFKTTDTVGNTAVFKATTITVNPDANIPTVELSSHNDLGKTAGVVNLMGTASDNEKVASVKITKLEYTTATEVTASTPSETSTDASDAATKWVSITPTAEMLVTGKGTVENGMINCAGTTSWKASIDTSKIASDVTAIRVTVESFDENGTSSSKVHVDGTTKEECTKRILVDKTVPKLDSASIVGFASATVVTSNTTPAFEKTYSSGMYISEKNADKLYLKLKISDDSSVTGINFSCDSGSAIEAVSTGDDGTITGEHVDNGQNTRNYTVLLPIDMTTEGHIYATLEMLDGQHSDVTQNFSFYIDNTAPVLYNAAGEDISLTGTTDKSVRLLNESNQTLGETYLVENSNGSFVFGDSVTEAGAGLQYLAFWFKRTGTETRAYNPMYKKEGTKDNKIIIGTEAATNGSIYINNDGLACMYVTGTGVTTDSDSDTSTITLTSAANVDDNVRVGGLIKYDGAYRKITATGAGAVKFTPAATATNQAVNAELIYAQVVDHVGIEVDDKYDDTSNGDGDGMTEVLKVKGAECNWQSSLDSSNIPDGPIEIYVTAIDNAGNISHGTVSTMIANNRPRITRVMLATDLNGNGTFDFYNEKSDILNNLSKDETTVSGTQFGEFVFYSTLKPSLDASNKVGDGQSLITLNASRTFRVKKDLLVLPEFVGGNGELKYGSEIGTKDASGNTVTATAPISGTYALKNTAEDLKLADKAGTNQLVSTLIQSGENSGNYGGVVFAMDNSDETISALDDNEAKNIAVTLWDNTDETTQGTDSLWAMINIPAYIDVSDTTDPTGTITPFWWNSKEDSSFVYDANGNPEGHIDIDAGNVDTKPGVAGKVWINGTAYDETRIGEIHVIKPDTTTDVKVIWWGLKTGSTTEYEWKLADGAEIIKEDEPSQDGHTIKWRYQMNMTEYGVATNKVVRTYVVDAQTNNNEAAAKEETTQTTKAEPKAMYKMDFVPYIKSIYPASASSANRSRLGKYSVRAGEDMIIEGMNFGSATATDYTVTFKNSAGDSETGTVTAAEIGKITVTAPQYSRYVEVTLDGVTTKNNTNTNGGYNIEAGYVAGAKDSSGVVDHGFSKANAAGTNFWTDDRYVSVWKVGTKFVNSENPIAGTMETINSSTKIYSSAREGWTFANNTIYGIWGGNDNMIYNEALSKEGTTHANERYYIMAEQASGALRSPLSETDTAIINNNVFHVWLDDGWADKETFGYGLQLVRDGETASVSASYVEKTSSDKVRHQFQNVKIAGAYKNSKYYVYTTYYDAYTRCLKYGMFEFKNEWDMNRSVTAKHIADDEGSFVIDGYDAADNSNISWDVGKWSDIKIDNTGTNPIPVVVYYDTVNHCLKLVRGSSTIPVTKRYAGRIGTGADAEPWISSTISSPNGSSSDFGRYVTMEMDNSGNLHIVARDESFGRVYYGYFKKSNNTYSISTDGWICVDSTSSVGRWIDIKLENPAETSIATCKPVITYQNAEKLNTVNALKIAYINNGTWEAITVPSKYEPQDAKLSMLVGALDKDGIANKYAVGFNSTEFAVDFLRGEE